MKINVLTINRQRIEFVFKIYRGYSNVWSEYDFYFRRDANHANRDH